MECMYEVHTYIHVYVRTYSAAADVEYKVTDNIKYFGSKLFFISIILT